MCIPSCYQACHRHVVARAVPMHSHCTLHCTSGCIQRRHPVHQALHGWPLTGCASLCSQLCSRAGLSGCMGCIAAHGVPGLLHGTPRSIRPCTPHSRPTCRRLASNAPDLRPSACSLARWLPVQQRHRAAIAGSECERQRRKARQKGAAPVGPQSQSARGGGAARSGFAAVPRGARGPLQCRYVRVLRTTGHAVACRESSHD